jgi:hypothetical protein
MMVQGAASSLQQFVANRMVLPSSVFHVHHNHQHNIPTQVHEGISCCLVGFRMTEACGTGEAWASVAKAKVDGPDSLPFQASRHPSLAPRGEDDPLWGCPLTIAWAERQGMPLCGTAYLTK